MRSITSHRGRLACIVVWLLAASGGVQRMNAQTAPTQSGVQFHGGLFTTFGGQQRSVLATVAEVGPRTVESRVQIVFYNEKDQIVASTQGVLKRGQPVKLEVALGNVFGRIQLRPSFSIVGPANAGRAPVVTLEDIDGASLTVVPRIFCAPPASHEGPAEPNCPPGVINNIAFN